MTYFLLLVLILGFFFITGWLERERWTIKRIEYPDIPAILAPIEEYRRVIIESMGVPSHLLFSDRSKISIYEAEERIRVGMSRFINEVVIPEIREKYGVKDE